MTGLKRPAVVNSKSQMCHNFSSSCTLEHRVLQTYAGPIGNTGCAVSLGLMDSEENYSRRSQRRINTLIRINGNRFIFSPDSVIALSHFFAPSVPTSKIPSPLLTIPPQLSLSQSPVFWPHFLFLNRFIFFFLQALIQQILQGNLGRWNCLMS